MKILLVVNIRVIKLSLYLDLCGVLPKRNILLCKSEENNTIYCFNPRLIVFHNVTCNYRWQTIAITDIYSSVHASLLLLSSLGFFFLSLFPHLKGE